MCNVTTDKKTTASTSLRHSCSSKSMKLITLLLSYLQEIQLHLILNLSRGTNTRNKTLGSRSSFHGIILINNLQLNTENVCNNNLRRSKLEEYTYTIYKFFIHFFLLAFFLFCSTNSFLFFS